MTIKKHIVERRKQSRFKIKGRAFVEFQKHRFFKLGKPHVIKSAEIIDVSLEGLAFQYTDRNMWAHDFNELSISKTDDDIKIGNIPFKAVSDFSVSRLSNSMFIRRCGIKFGELTPAQKLQLDYFIRNHTVGEA